MDKCSICVEGKDRDIVGITGFHEPDGGFDTDEIKVVEQARRRIEGEGVFFGKEAFFGILSRSDEDTDMFHKFSQVFLEVVQV